jgi:hypothetical protein
VHQQCCVSQNPSLEIVLEVMCRSVRDVSTRGCEYHAMVYMRCYRGGLLSREGGTESGILRCRRMRTRVLPFDQVCSIDIRLLDIVSIQFNPERLMSCNCGIELVEMNNSV